MFELKLKQGVHGMNFILQKKKVEKSHRCLVVHEKQYIFERFQQRQHYTQCEWRIVQTSERRWKMFVYSMHISERLYQTVRVRRDSVVLSFNFFFSLCAAGRILAFDSLWKAHSTRFAQYFSGSFFLLFRSWANPIDVKMCASEW